MTALPKLNATRRIHGGNVAAGAAAFDFSTNSNACGPCPAAWHAVQAAQALDGMAASWPIGAHGEAMLLAWTQAQVQDWVAQTLPTLRGWKQNQADILQAQGWHCLDSEANFFCARPPAATDVQCLLQFLRTQGIKLRDATSLGLPGWLRLSAQSPAAQQALHAGLVAWATLPQAQACAHLSTDFAAQAHPPTSSLETSQ